MEGASGNGSTLNHLPSPICLRCPSVPHQPQSVVRERPHMSTVSFSSQLETHLGWVQDKFVTGPLHLAAQPGIEVHGEQRPKLPLLMP